MTSYFKQNLKDFLNEKEMGATLMIANRAAFLFLFFFNLKKISDTFECFCLKYS